MSLYTDFDHYDSPVGTDGTPYEYFEALRDEAIETKKPIGWSEKYGGFWVATGWEESRDIQHNPEVFSNLGVTFPAYAAPDGAVMMMAQQDEPAHKKYRKIVQSAFTPQKAEEIAGALAETVNELIDGFIEKGRVDIVEEMTNQVPAMLTAIILGLPADEGIRYRTWTHAMAQEVHTNPERAAQHMRELDEYFAETLAERKKNLGDDVLSLVIESEVDGERLTDQEIKDFFVVLLLGGIDNTTKLLGSMLWRLGWDKELRRRLASHKEMLPSAIDEFLRYYTPGLAARLVQKPIEIHGVKMEPGQHVVMFHPISNRDPRQFEDPDVFLPERTPNRHFGLGLGIHRCLGAYLVRVEARVVAEEFLGRVPHFELDPELKPRWLHGQVAGMEEVPIVFPQGGGQPSEGWSPASALAGAAS